MVCHSLKSFCTLRRTEVCQIGIAFVFVGVVTVEALGLQQRLDVRN